jgi:hypothetical protein
MTNTPTDADTRMSPAGAGDFVPGTERLIDDPTGGAHTCGPGKQQFMYDGFEIVPIPSSD